VRKLKMGKSKEFNREGDADVKKVVTRTGPLGMIPVFYIALSLLIVIAVLFWWIS
jgi:hypothetical protein